MNCAIKMTIQAIKFTKCNCNWLFQNFVFLKRIATSVKQLLNYFLREKNKSIRTTRADFSSACVAFLFQLTS